MWAPAHDLLRAPDDAIRASEPDETKDHVETEVPLDRRAGAKDAVHCERARLRWAFSARSCTTSASQLWREREVERPASPTTITTATVVITSAHAFDAMIGGMVNGRRDGMRSVASSSCSFFRAALFLERNKFTATKFNSKP